VHIAVLCVIGWLIANAIFFASWIVACGVARSRHPDENQTPAPTTPDVPNTTVPEQRTASDTELSRERSEV